MLFVKHKVRDLCRSTTQWSLISISYDERHPCTAKDQSQCWGDFPGGPDSKNFCLQCGRSWFNPFLWKDLLEKEMATHSSTPAWKIPWTEEPRRLQSVGSQRVRRDWATSLFIIESLDLPRHLLAELLSDTGKARHLTGTAKSLTKAVSLLGIENINCYEDWHLSS